MGREAECSCNWAGTRASVKALIEPPDLILRGELRRRVPLAQLENVHAEGDELRFHFQGEEVSIRLGSTPSAKWAKAITTPPPTLAKKLGITSETRVHLVGAIDDALREALAAAQVSKTSGNLIVARVNNSAELKAALKAAAAELAQGVAIWFVYPKGRGQALSEGDIRAAALATGLVDTKVAAVSPVLTALRCVKRRA